jgi:hypothetical protein
MQEYILEAHYGWGQAQLHCQQQQLKLSCNHSPDGIIMTQQPTMDVDG